MGQPHEAQAPAPDEHFRAEVRDQAAQEIGVVYYGIGGGGFVLWAVLVYLVVAAAKEVISAFIVGSKYEKFERAAIQVMALLVGPVTAPLGYVLWRLFDKEPPDALTFFALGFLVSGAAMLSHFLWNYTPVPELLAKLTWNFLDFASTKFTGRPLGTIKGQPVTDASLALHARKRRRTMPHAAIGGPDE